MIDIPYDKGNPISADQQDYEGDSSFYSQSRRIADTLSQAVSSSPNNVSDVQATTAGIVQSLIQDARIADSLVQEESKSRSASSTFSQYPELAGLRLPPMDAVLRLLAFAKTSPQRYFNYPHTDQDEFANLCQKLYFPTRPFTIFAWIIVNCGLFYLFRDLDASHHDKLHLRKSQVTDIVVVCSDNIDRAVSSLRFCIDPSLEAVAALVTAGAVNMERANGRVAWKLISAAAMMSIDLGYHRLPPGYGDKQRSQKRKLFWFVLSMDKSLAFNYGRSSTIQDYDVTTERPTAPGDFDGECTLIFHAFIDFASIQYEVYVQLFSATAQRDPLSIRCQRVHDLAMRISHIRERFAALMDQKDVVFRGTDICLSSILTLIYRVLPPDDPVGVQGSTSEGNNPLQFHTLCVEAGRTALKALVGGWNELSSEKDEDVAKVFVNWTLHHIPFMPYLAVFGNQIATGSMDDLQLLRKVASIVGVAVQANSALNKMYKAFSRLLKIAELWTSTSGISRQGRSDSSQAVSTSTHDQGSHFPVSNEHATSNGHSADVNMMGATATDFSMTTWQDLDMANQDWDMMFNEFDLGLGAESAREMMPWFEQHMTGFETFN